ncbi:MAG: CPBP family intramembrane metalloprotease [Erysipelotrichaceae bacterium]|nr:CPBP family intramembrane metalloprotease [Erysipelotrichaceae bacterium]
MSNIKGKRISRKTAVRHFNIVGTLLTVYTLFVLVIPFVFHYYLVSTDSDILKDTFLYFGIYFIVIVFGTVIPFWLMRKFFQIPLRLINTKIRTTFVNLFVQTIVFFTICIVSTYVSNILFAYFGLEGKLISSIGLSYDAGYLDNLLYVFMLVIVTPMIEEYAFRGVLLSVLGRYGKNFGLYASAVVFAFAHVHFAEYLPAFCMGVLLGKTALRYRSIGPTIIIHILFNVLIYSLCVIPSSIAGYMAYGLAGVFVISIYLYISGRYERVYVQKLNSASNTYLLFFSCFMVILSLMLMILQTIFSLFI